MRTLLQINTTFANSKAQIRGRSLPKELPHKMQMA